MRWGEENNGEWEGVMAGLKLRASTAPGSRNDLARAGSLESGEQWLRRALFISMVEDSSGRYWDGINHPYSFYIMGLWRSYLF